MSGIGQAQGVYRQTKSGVIAVEALKIQIHFLDLSHPYLGAYVLIATLLNRVGALFFRSKANYHGEAPNKTPLTIVLPVTPAAVEIETNPLCVKLLGYISPFLPKR